MNTELKRGVYWVRVKSKVHGVIAQRVNGYIVTDAESGLTFGAHYWNGRWRVTELSTGLLVSLPENKPKNAADILPFIERIRPAVLSAMRSHTDTQFFAELIEKAKARDTAGT